MSKVVSLADERIYLFALEGNLKEVRKHIIGGGNVLASHPIHNGDTALHAACANGHLDVCKYLCSVGANEHHGNDKGNAWAPTGKGMVPGVETIFCFLFLS